VLDEDLEIMEALPDDTLPLAPDAEEHTRADRGGLAWRRALLDLIEEVEGTGEDGEAGVADPTARGAGPGPDAAGPHEPR